MDSANNAMYAIVAKPGWHESLSYTNGQYFQFDHWSGNDVNGDGGTPDWIGTGTWQTGTTYPPGAWYHVCGVWNRSNGIIQVWVNGALAGQADHPDGLPNREYGQAPWYIGIANPGASSWRWAARGAVDDVRFYNRALADNEVRELAAGLPAPSGLSATGNVNQMSLSWTAPAGFVGAYTYDIYRAPAAGGPFSYLASTTSTSYVDSSATYPGSYYYYIVAVSSVGESGPTAVSGGSPQPIPPRTGDHEEGFVDQRCSCGSARPPAVPLAAGVSALAAGLLLAARRRR